MNNALPPPSDNEKPDSIEHQIWLPMPGESNRWYQRFSQYLAMGPARSFRAVYNAEKGNERSKAVPASWSQATKRFEWQRRAEAYDAWQRRKVFSKGNAQDTERVKKLDELVDKLYERTIKMLEKALPEVAFNEKLVTSLVSAIDLLAKHTGGYTQRLEHTGKNGEPIEVHEEQSMRVFFYLPEVASMDVVETDPALLPEPDEQG